MLSGHPSKVEQILLAMRDNRVRVVAMPASTKRVRWGLPLGGRQIFKLEAYIVRLKVVGGGVHIGGDGGVAVEA